MSKIEYTNRCPKCGEINCIPFYVFKMVKMHEGIALRAPCNHCNQVLQFHLSGVIKINSIMSVNGESDFKEE